jgi:predicted RNase H-like HicB family nuclease
MMKVLDSCAAITLRDHGGVVWVRAPYAEAVRRLQIAAKLAIEDDSRALKAEVEGFMASPPDRPSTLVRRLDAFEHLQARANLYRHVLHVHVADVEKTLAELTTSVETLLNQKAAA